MDYELQRAFEQVCDRIAAWNFLFFRRHGFEIIFCKCYDPWTYKAHGHLAMAWPNGDIEFITNVNFCRMAPLR